nr:hypothetical protein [Tanacetum cinerariifolium]
MNCRRDIKRANVHVDRLSSLPDDLIHKIMYFIGLRRAIGTSVLSSRWRYIWTSMPCLDFSSMFFSTLPKSSTYVTNVLSRRNNLEQVFSIKFCFSGDVKQEFVKQIMKPYALIASPTLELPALTILYLGNVTMREGFCSFEKVYLGVYGGLVADAPRIFRLLQHLQSVKFLTLSLESVELLY